MPSRFKIEAQSVKNSRPAVLKQHTSPFVERKTETIYENRQETNLNR